MKFINFFNLTTLFYNHNLYSISIFELCDLIKIVSDCLSLSLQKPKNLLMFLIKCFFSNIIADNWTKLFVITVNSPKLVRYNHEIFLIKHAEPNQATHFVRYNRVFVITVIAITEFDCTFKVNFKSRITKAKFKKLKTKAKVLELKIHI